MKFPKLIDYSQYGQPEFIRKYIPASAPKWVIDVGAHDGIEGSNSRALILEGWTALLIEPLPSVFEHLRANTAGMQNVTLEQYACGQLEGEATFHIGHDGPDGQTSSLCEDEVWKDNWSGEEIKVQVRTLESLLNKHNCPTDFALLLVDAEGMDLEVLKSLDFSHYKPAVICTELYATNPDKEKLKQDFLVLNGYRQQGRVGSDTIWSRSDLEISANEDISHAPDLYCGDQLPHKVSILPVKSGASVAFDGARSMGDVLTISGWAFSPQQTVPETLFVGIKTQNGMRWQQSYRCVRSDVARHFGNEDLLFTGFRASFPDPAQHILDVMVVQVQDDSRWDAGGTVNRTEE